MYIFVWIKHSCFALDPNNCVIKRFGVSEEKEELRRIGRDGVPYFWSIKMMLWGSVRRLMIS